MNSHVKREQFTKKYLQPTSLYEEAARRCNEITEYCKIIEDRLGKYPKGKIHTVNKKGNVQYYLRNEENDKSEKYLSKRNQQIIKEYIQKRYDEKEYMLLKKEQKSLDKLLKNSANTIGKIRALYSENPLEVKNHINPVDISDEDYIQEWESKSYQGKEISTDCPVFITNKGEHVRSKSELNIANMLEKLNIPYKYECPLTLSDNRVIYPDFTVLNIKKRKIVYWEHRGMMDDREYAKHAVQRVKQLSKEGIVIGDNLVITEETQTCPLGTDEIEAVIKIWFTND